MPTKDNIFEVEIYNPYKNRQKKRILIAIDHICMKKGGTYYTLRSVKHTFVDSSMAAFSNIRAALWDEHKNVSLSADYTIKMVKITE